MEDVLELRPCLVLRRPVPILGKCLFTEESRFRHPGLWGILQDCHERLTRLRLDCIGGACVAHAGQLLSVAVRKPMILLTTCGM